MGIPSRTECVTALSVRVSCVCSNDVCVRTCGAVYRIPTIVPYLFVFLRGARPDHGPGTPEPCLTLSPPAVCLLLACLRPCGGRIQMHHMGAYLTSCDFSHSDSLLPHIRTPSGSNLPRISGSSTGLSTASIDASLCFAWLYTRQTMCINIVRLLTMSGFCIFRHSRL